MTVTAAKLNAHAIGHAKWTPVVIAVLDRDAKPNLSVIAKARGKFAVHKSLSWEVSKAYVLTHIQSGGMVCGSKSEKELIELADNIEPLWSWDFTDPQVAANAPHEVKVAVSVLCAA